MRTSLMAAAVILANACTTSTPSPEPGGGPSGSDSSGGSGSGSGSNTGSGSSGPAFTFNVNSEASSGVIDVQNAYALTRLCDFTYDDTSQIPQALSSIGIDPTAGNYQAFYDPSTQAFAYYVEAGGAAFVVFRGTELNWQNLSEDADFFPSDEIVGQVDDGFQISIDGVWSDIRNFLVARQASTSLPLYITGHSMGAAMASIATARALLDTANGTIAVAAFYALASPRVGNAAFANGIANAMQAAGVFFGRVVNDCDPVTNVPERVGPALIPFYQHISLDSNENDFVDWMPINGPLEFSIPLNACPLAGFDYDFSEHLTPAYIAALQELL